VRPVTASTVMTAPLWGRSSIPPLAIEVTRCITSNGIPAVCAMEIKRVDIAAKAIPKPPEAEPVMPASVVVVMEAFKSGCEMVPRVSRTATKPGSAEITAPKPYSEPGIHRCQQSAAYGQLRTLCDLESQPRYPITTTMAIPITSAPSRAHTLTMLDTFVIRGEFSPGRTRVEVEPNRPRITDP